MEKKYTSLHLYTRIKPIEKINDEFSLCKVFVQGVGKNRNFSYMSKENIQEALPSLSYIPVVGHLIPKYDEQGKIIGHYFGGHDYEITPDWELKPLTVPFGVVVEDSFDFEMIEEFGDEVEYLTANIVLWTGRYPELNDAIFSDDIWFNESMEINVDQYRVLEEDSNYTELLKWSYSALCLLGLSDNPDEHTEPCFISSKVVPIEYGFDKSEFQLAMSELKGKLKSYFTKPIKEGGTKMTDKIRDNILIEFNLKLEDLDFEITEDMTENDFKAKINEYINNKPEEKPAFSNKEFSTYNQKREAIRNALDTVIVKDGDNIISETYFWVCDFDDEYVFVERNTYTTDDYKCDHGRFKYTFNEENVSVEITSEFELMILTWLTVEENQKLENSRKVFDELVQFKKERLEEDHINAVFEIVSEFEDIYENKEFIKFADNILDIQNLDDIKTKCYAIRGKQVQIKSNKNFKKSVRVPVGAQAKPEPYGGLFSMYSNK